MRRCRFDFSIGLMCSVPPLGPSRVGISTITQQAPHARLQTFFGATRVHCGTRLSHARAQVKESYANWFMATSRRLPCAGGGQTVHQLPRPRGTQRITTLDGRIRVR
eukprot:scaffold290811_cov38-Tisochrysis_lutea.AAC.3